MICKRKGRNSLSKDEMTQKLIEMYYDFKKDLLKKLKDQIEDLFPKEGVENLLSELDLFKVVRSGVSSTKQEDAIRALAISLYESEKREIKTIHGETKTVLFKGKSGSVEKAVRDWKNFIEEIVEIAAQMMPLVSRLGDETNKEINEKQIIAENEKLILQDMVTSKRYLFLFMTL